MAKKPSKAAPKDGDLEQAPKKGLFSFLRRKKKNKTQNQDDNANLALNEAEVENDDDVAAEKKPATKKTRKTTAKKKPAAAKNTAAKKAPSTPKSTKEAPKRKRGQPKKQVEEAQVAAAVDHAEDEASPIDGKKKRSLFGFLKRKKKAKKPVEEQVLAKDVADEQATEKKPKKKLFGFLSRKKKAKTSVEEPVVEEIVPLEPTGDMPVGTGMIDVDIEDTAPVKKSIFNKKMLIIVLSGFALTATSGAAAVMFVSPGFLDKNITGLACDVVHEVEFELMKENRVTSYIRADSMPTKERVLMVLNYTKFLSQEYPESQLVTVSLLDTEGPTSRRDFRGTNIGAQVVFAPDPLLTQATKQQWEVRYVNADRAYGGKFIGDRYELTPEEISLLSEEIIEPSGCYVPEEEMTEEELAEKERLEAEALAAEEAAQAALEAEEAKNAEPGMIDNVLAFVGLGGSSEEAMALEEGMTEENANIYPGDKVEMEAEEMEKETGFFDGLLQMVGLGSDENAAQNEQKVDVLGTKIRYN